MLPTKSTSKKHDKDCHLGSNWKQCACCVEQWNDTCSPKEVMKVPGESKPLIQVTFKGDFSPDDKALVLKYLSAVYVELGGSGLKVLMEKCNE